MLKELRTVALTAVLLGAAGCDSLLGTDVSRLRRPAIIEFNTEPVVITVPATATVGTPVQVRIRTWGTGCHTLGGDAVQVNGLDIRIDPYNFEELDRSCAGPGTIIEHTVAVTFPVAGNGRVRIFGLRLPGEQLVTHTHDVVVQP